MAEKIKLAVIGSPVGHSLSPFIHRRFAETLGLDIEYEKREVTSETLEAFIAEARRGGLRGFNVTMPLKKAILPYLAERDDISRECGAVNTVVSRDGWLFGHNTDGLGIVRSLKSKIPELRDKKVLILGGGGLANIASAALRREEASASSVVRENSIVPGQNAVPRRALPWAKIARLAAEYDIIINATPLGMARGADTEEFEELTWLDGVRRDAVVFDAVYKPADTRLLLEARRRGITALGGLGMLVYQAEAAFRLFTGAEPPPSAAEDIIAELG